MKFILIFFIGLLNCISVSSQNSHLIDSLQNYFNSNVKTLDKIEGFWNIEVYSTLYKKDSILNKSYEESLSQWAIVKKDSLHFEVVDINFPSIKDFSASFEKVPLDLVYYYRCSFDVPSWSKECIAEYYSNGMIYYKYYVSQEYIKENYGEEYAGVFNLEWEFYWKKKTKKELFD